MNKKDKFEAHLNELEKFWWKPIMCMSALTVGVIFACWVIFNDSDYATSLNMINQWISVILGFIALTTSVISTLLGFYSMHSSQKTSDLVNEKLTRILEKQEYIEKSVFLKNDSDTVSKTFEGKSSNSNTIALTYGSDDE